MTTTDHAIVAPAVTGDPGTRADAGGFDPGREWDSRETDMVFVDRINRLELRQLGTGPIEGSLDLIDVDRLIFLARYGAQSRLTPEPIELTDGATPEALTRAVREAVEFAYAKRLATTVRFSDNLGNELRARAQRAESRADALQARLTEAEQRAATAERRGFEAGALVMREAAAREAFSLSGNGKIAAAIRFLAPAVPQEGETTR